MTTEVTPIYTALAHITGGRDGRATADRGTPDLVLIPPAALGGPEESGEGTNPEELFSLGYGACFLSTLQFVTRKRRMSSKAFTLDATVDLNPADGGFELGVSLSATMPGVEESLATELMRDAHSQCVYSKAIAGNVAVRLEANGQPVN